VNSAFGDVDLANGGFEAQLWFGRSEVLDVERNYGAIWAFRTDYGGTLTTQSRLAGSDQRLVVLWWLVSGWFLSTKKACWKI
jgi:hypothetical protein